MKIPFFRLSFGAAERREILDVLNSGWVTSGPKVNLLEKSVRELVGARYAAAVSSGTAGLHLVLTTLGLKPSDEVITTPYTMAATMEAILYTGATPVFADIEPGSMNLSPSSAREKITKRTRAVISVDIAGYPCDYDRLKELTAAYGLFLLADAAHSFGAKYRSMPVGRLADATVFSFYSTKNITTGEGGMVVSDSKRLIDKVRHLSLHGMTSSGWKRYSGGGWKYDVTALGYKYNLSDLAAALGLGQLRHFPALQEKRRKLAEKYIENLKNLNEFLELPGYSSESEPSWHLFIVKIRPERWRIRRDRLIAELERRGVGCGVHFIPIYRFSYFKKVLGATPSEFPHCERVFRRVISLPLYPELTFAEVDYICATLYTLAKKFAR
jgi:dTDP-4-amino-4,6-dideoxygalactose transaminase